MEKTYSLSENYILNNDIILTEEWQPIGNENEPFTGIFDGNGYTINDLTVTEQSNNMDFSVQVKEQLSGSLF